MGGAEGKAHRFQKDSAMSIHEELRQKTLPRLPGKRETLHLKSLEYRTADISRDELVAYLDGEIRKGRSILEEFGDARLDDETRILMRDMLDPGRRGIAAHLEALALMKEWADSPQKTFLETALALAAQGDSFLNDAIQVGWELSITLDEAACELLRALGVDPG